MNAQDFLTYTFDLIFFGYAALMLIDLIDRIGGELWEIFWPEQNTTSKEDDMPRTKMQHVSPGQLSLFDIKPEPLPQLPDPWTLPVDDVAFAITLQHSPAQQPQKPLLLLPQAKEVSAQPPLPTTTEPTRDELLAGVDLDNLQLRPARKMCLGTRGRPESEQARPTPRLPSRSNQGKVAKTSRTATRGT